MNGSIASSGYGVPGMSANEIAQKLGGTSRNAVIGKLSRLGLANPTDRRIDGC